MEPRAEEIPNIVEIIASLKRDVPLDVRSSSLTNFSTGNPVVGLMELLAELLIIFFAVIVEGECPTLVLASRHEVCWMRGSTSANIDKKGSGSVLILFRSALIAHGR